MSKEAIEMALEALEYIEHNYMSLPAPAEKAITALREALAEQPAQHRAWFTVDELNAWADKKLKENPQWAEQPAQTATYTCGVCGVSMQMEQPAQQEPVAKVCHDLDGHIGWNPNLRQLPDEGAALYTSPPTLSLAQRPHECSRSHPHENMNAMCELRTEIARLTNENARLKAMHQDDEINTYRMTLLCIRDGLQQGMSKSIQKLQAREINDVLGLPSFASYRTSPPAQRKPLTEEEIIKCWGQVSGTRHGYVAFARAIEAAHGIKENT